MLHCFKGFSKTTEFSFALKTCHENDDEIPLIATKERRDAVVQHGLPTSMVPFWIDLRSLTRVEFTGTNVSFGK